MDNRLRGWALAAFLWASFYTLLRLLGLLAAPLLALGAIPAAVAAIAIWRRRAAGAYGYALFWAICIPFEAVPNVQRWLLVAVLVFNLANAGLFFMAGRRLAGPVSRFSLSMWAATALLFSAPFLFVGGFFNPSDSMAPTVLMGDNVLVRKFPRPAPTYDSIVAFRHDGQILLKRVIGMPGDHITVDRKQVTRNGRLLTEPYARYRFGGRPVAAELTVPSGSYYLLGDNRDDSWDSRDFGPVPAKDIIGTALLVYDSDVMPWNFSEHPFPRVRWNRVLKPL